MKLSHYTIETEYGEHEIRVFLQGAKRHYVGRYTSAGWLCTATFPPVCAITPDFADADGAMLRTILLAANVPNHIEAAQQLSDFAAACYEARFSSAA